MPRYSRGVANPHALWMVVLFGTVLGTVLIVSHVFVTLRNCSWLNELYPKGSKQYTWADDDIAIELSLLYEPRYVAWEAPSLVLGLYNETEWDTHFRTDNEWMDAVHAWSKQSKCWHHKVVEDYLIEDEGRPGIPQQNLHMS